MKNGILAGAILVLISLCGCSSGHNAGPKSHDVHLKHNQMQTIFDVALTEAEENRDKTDQQVLQRILEIRGKVGLRGYEKSREFAKGAQRFAESLRFDRDLVAENLDANFWTVTRLSLAGNATEFDSFYQQHISTDPALKTYSPEEIKRIMLRLAARAYQQDKQLWLKAWKFTYIHPVCIPRDPSPLLENELRRIKESVPKYPIRNEDQLPDASIPGEIGRPAP